MKNHWTVTFFAQDLIHWSRTLYCCIHSILFSHAPRSRMHLNIAEWNLQSAMLDIKTKHDMSCLTLFFTSAVCRVHVYSQNCRSRWCSRIAAIYPTKYGIWSWVCLVYPWEGYGSSEPTLEACVWCPCNLWWATWRDAWVRIYSMRTSIQWLECNLLICGKHIYICCFDVGLQIDGFKDAPLTNSIVSELSVRNQSWSSLQNRWQCVVVPRSPPALPSPRRRIWWASLCGDKTGSSKHLSITLIKTQLFVLV